MSDSSGMNILSHIPAKRVGELIKDARKRAGLSPGAASYLTGIPRASLALIERGATLPDSEQLESMAQIYGISIHEIIPKREPLEFDLRAGTMRVGAKTVHFDASGKDNLSIIREYVAAVKELRGLPGAYHFHLRADDLANLSEVLDLTDGFLAYQIATAMKMNFEEASGLALQMV